MNAFIAYVQTAARIVADALTTRHYILAHKSSWLAAIAYNPRTREAQVTLQNGAIYTIKGICPCIVEDFAKAQSSGRAFNHIKKFYSIERVGGGVSKPALVN